MQERLDARTLPGIECRLEAKAKVRDSWRDGRLGTTHGRDPGEDVLEGLRSLYQEWHGPRRKNGAWCRESRAGASVLNESRSFISLVPRHPSRFASGSSSASNASSTSSSHCVPRGLQPECQAHQKRERPWRMRGDSRRRRPSPRPSDMPSAWRSRYHFRPCVALSVAKKRTRRVIPCLIL